MLHMHNNIKYKDISNRFKIINEKRKKKSEVCSKDEQNQFPEFLHPTGWVCSGATICSGSSGGEGGGGIVDLFLPLS